MKYGSYPRHLWNDDKHGRVKVSRQNVAVPMVGAAPGREVIVKVIGYGKSARSAAAMIEYISEGSEHLKKPAEIYSSDGETYKHTEAGEIVKKWDLKSDAENESKKARSMGADRRDLPENERLRERQVVHIAISLPRSEGELSEAQIKNIVSETLDPFRKAGFDYVFTVHPDHKNQHAHIVMKYRSKYGQRLVIKPQDIQKIRENVVHAAKKHNYNYQATPFDIKKKLPIFKFELKDGDKGAFDSGNTSTFVDEALESYRKAGYSLDYSIEQGDGKTVILAWAKEKRPTKGEFIKRRESERDAFGKPIEHKTILEEWRSPKTLRELQALVPSIAAKYGAQSCSVERLTQFPTKEGPKFKPSPYMSESLKNRAPNYVMRHGASLALERSNLQTRRSLPAPQEVVFPDLPKRSQALIDQSFERMYDKPEVAKARFLELLAEDRKLAMWHLENQPNTFGFCRNPSAYNPEIAHAAVPPDWRDRARQAIAEAIRQEPSEVQQVRANVLATMEAAKATEYQLHRDQETAPLRNAKPDLADDQRRSQESIQRPLYEPAKTEASLGREKIPPAFRNTPNWYLRHGARIEAERTGHKLDPSLLPKNAILHLQHLPQNTLQRMDVHFQGYQNPEAAKTAFLEMAAENKASAFWNLNHNPKTFGQVRENVHISRVSQREWALPDEWRDLAKKGLDGMKIADHALEKPREQIIRALRQEPSLPDKQHLSTRMEDVAPNWYAKHGYGWEARRVGGRVNADLLIKENTSAPRFTKIDPEPRSFNRDKFTALLDAHKGFTASEKRVIASKIEKGYEKPIEALASFLDKAKINQVEAYRQLELEPQSFGRVRKPEFKVEQPERPMPALKGLAPDAVRELSQKFVAAYKVPDRALAAYLDLAAENPSLAQGSLARTPAMFGALKESVSKVEVPKVQFSTQWQRDNSQRLATEIRNDGSKSKQRLAEARVLALKPSLQVKAAHEARKQKQAASRQDYLNRGK